MASLMLYTNEVTIAYIRSRRSIQLLYSSQNHPTQTDLVREISRRVPISVSTTSRYLPAFRHMSVIRASLVNLFVTPPSAEPVNDVRTPLRPYRSVLCDVPFTMTQLTTPTRRPRSWSRPSPHGRHNKRVLPKASAEYWTFHELKNNLRFCLTSVKLTQH